MFSDQGRAESYDQDLAKSYQKLAENWKASEANYKDADAYYKGYQKNVSQIAGILDDLHTYYKDESQKLFVHMEECRQNSKKDSEFSEKADQFIQGNTEELTKKIKHLDAVKAKMREILNGLNPKKLSELKVNEQPALKEFFAAFFEVFYKGKGEEFDWNKFKQNAIIKDKCDDFIVRLCTIDFSAIDEDSIAKLEKIKTNSFITKFANEDSKGENLLDLLDYLEFVPEASKTQKSINDIEKNIKKIKTDAPIRKERAVYEKDKAEKLDQDIKFLEEYDKKYAKYINDFTEHLNSYQKISDDYNQHRNALIKNVVEKYNQIQNVPTKLYA